MRRKMRISIRVMLTVIAILFVVATVPDTARAEIKNRWWVHATVGREGERSISDGGMEYDGKHYKWGYRIPKKEDKGRWRHNSKGWWFEWPDGTYPTHAILLIDGEYYYFNDRGYMAQDGYYWGVYYSRTGAMQFGKGCVNAGFYTDKNGRKWFGSYVPNEKGEYQLVWWKKNGWLQNHGNWYYFVNGYAVTGHPRLINGKRYYFNESGKCINP